MTINEDSSSDGIAPTIQAVRRDALPLMGNAIFTLVFDDLLQRIRRGDWLPGERLPSITQLARSFAVSPASVREALRSLQSIGLVHIQHGRGVFVAHIVQPPGLLDQLGDFDLGVLVALAETRRIFEPELAALAAERGTSEELQEILALAQQMEQRVQEQQDFSDPDLLFHRRIAQAAHNVILERMMESVHDLIAESRKVTMREPGMTPRAVRYHLLIAETIRERNGAQARLLMLAHMNDILSSLLATDVKG
jgi:GntR family transcriptional repressor for pyruvate dehydrogenase complex